MELKPGESTSVSINFVMHGEEMGGFHDFRLHLLTNDPEQPDRELVVLSNWIP